MSNCYELSIHLLYSSENHEDVLVDREEFKTLEAAINAAERHGIRKDLWVKDDVWRGEKKNSEGTLFGVIEEL